MGDTADQRSDNPALWDVVANSARVGYEATNVVSNIRMAGGVWAGSFDYDWDGYGILEGESLELLDAFDDCGPIDDEGMIFGTDSGGPSMIYDDGAWKIAGIHSGKSHSPFLGTAQRIAKVHLELSAWTRA